MRARRLLVPALVVFLGISSSLRQYQRATDAEIAELTERLADAGDQLAVTATDLFLVAAEQAQAIRGLYESSNDVTKEEFAHFVSVMGTSMDNRMVFARRVTTAELDHFVSNAKLVEPDFRLHGQSEQPRDAYWLLLFSSESDLVGYEYGFDFGSVPQIKVAIETSLAENRAVASDLIEVPGDDEEGDLVVVSTIGREVAPLGAAIVTLRLDELLAPRVEQLLGEDVRLEFGYEGPEIEPAVNQWSGTLDFAGQPVGLLIELGHVERNSSVPWSLVFGVTTSLFLGWLIQAISRRRQLGREVAALQDTLAEKDRFLAGVSHELRTPLTVLVGSLSLLGGDQPLSQETRGMLIEDARVGAFELETLIEDYLTAARLSSGVMTFRRAPVDLDALVPRLLVGISPALSVSVGELGSVEGDSLRVRQILRNIINNAKRYARSEIVIRADQDQQRSLIEILNDGEPIPGTTAKRMFDPFYGERVPGQPKALGLGLSVSRDLARRMGGDLTYSYEAGYVTFRLSLPSYQPAALNPVDQRLSSPG